jgi:3-hydroxybutyrate dehydrogenase
VLGVAMDVTNEEQVDAGVARTVQQFGKIDVLVSNAGIQIVNPLEQFPFARATFSDAASADQLL